MSSAGTLAALAGAQVTHSEAASAGVDVPVALLQDNTATTAFDAHYSYQGLWVFEKLRHLRPERHVDVGSLVA
jgi:hypothetical protein